MPGYHTPEINVSWRKISSLTSLSPSTTSVFVIVCAIRCERVFVVVSQLCCWLLDILCMSTYRVYLCAISFRSSALQPSTYTVSSVATALRRFFFGFENFLFFFLLLYCRVFFFVHIGFCCWPLQNCCSTDLY